ncbi:hypothetical protein QAD02_014993 [Eretmocerus hayati]|uniref:Uncharacterized protein n=1 Tax=Eretmocerus hayati TaxID=131215 RepID=A0ACC2P704_9HYME|nr:hypothetical protein QAD02_014993 [Eretmocerus hayati]
MKSSRGKKVMNIEIKVKNNSKWALVAYQFEDIFDVNGKKPNVKTDFSCGQTRKLTIRSDTVVTNLTKMYFPNQEPVEARSTSPTLEDIKIYNEIQECVDENFKNGTPVGLEVFIRTPFVQGNPDVPLRWGALKDGKIKITTTIKNFSSSNVTFESGQRVTAFGKVIEYKDRAAFEVAHVNDIKVLEQEKKTLDELREIVKTPQKPNQSSKCHINQSVVKVRIVAISVSYHA